MRLIKQTYDTITPESAALGDYADSGWVDEEGVEIAPDEIDIDEGETFVSLAVKHLRDNYVSEASSSHFHTGVWYSSSPDIDYHTGEETTYNFHLKGFTVEEEEAIFNSITGKGKTW